MAALNSSLQTSINANVEIFLIGDPPTDNFPAEVRYANLRKIAEYRFRENYYVSTSPYSTAQTSCVQIKYCSPGRILRARATALITSYLTNINEIDKATRPNICPLPGIGITYWDTFHVQLGSNNHDVACVGNNHAFAAHMKFMGCMRKSPDVLKPTWQPAGFYDVKSFDYIGGVVGTNCAPQVPNNATPSVNEPASYIAGEHSWTTNSLPFNDVSYDMMHIGPFTSSLGTGGTPGFTSRSFEAGYWLDPEMSRYQLNTMGTLANPILPDTATQPTTCVESFNMMTRLSLVAECFDTVCGFPPNTMVELILGNPLNTSRPRYVCTPATLVSTVKENTTTLGSIPTAYKGLTFNIDNLRLFTNEFSLLANLQQAMVTSKSENISMSIPFINYSLNTYAVNAGVSSWEQTLVQQSGLVPHKICLGITNALPIAPAKSKSAAPLNTYLVPATYGNHNIQNMEFQLSVPTSSTLTLSDYNEYSRDVNEVGWNQQVNRKYNGIRNPRRAWREFNLRTQGYIAPVYLDLDSIHEYGETDKSMYNPPMHKTMHALANNLVIAGDYTTYGSHAVALDPAAFASQNSAPHNNITSVMFSPVGQESANIDYGVPKGSVQAKITFSSSPAVNIQIHILQLMMNVVTFNGAQASTNLT